MLDLLNGTTVTVKGKSWRIGGNGLDVMEKFRAWVKEQEGDPFDVVDRLADRLPPEAVSQLVREAMTKRDAIKLMDYGDPLFRRYQRSAVGSQRFLLLAVQQNHPEATLADVHAIALEAGWLKAEAPEAEPAAVSRS